MDTFWSDPCYELLKMTLRRVQLTFRRDFILEKSGLDLHFFLSLLFNSTEMFPLNNSTCIWWWKSEVVFLLRQGITCTSFLNVTHQHVLVFRTCLWTSTKNQGRAPSSFRAIFSMLTEETVKRRNENSERFQVTFSCCKNSLQNHNISSRHHTARMKLWPLPKQSVSLNLLKD